MTVELGDVQHLDRLDGWLSKWEGLKLAQLAAQVPAGQVIVELGSYRGKSSCFLAHGSRCGNRRPVYCVDLWALGGQWETTEARRPGVALHHDDPAHYEAFKANTAPYAGSIVEVHGHSHAIGKNWRGGRSVGLLFIDADHSHQGTMGDLVAWMPHVADGGWVAIHDYTNEDYPDIKRAVDEFFATKPLTDVSVTVSMLTGRVCDT